MTSIPMTRRIGLSSLAVLALILLAVLRIRADSEPRSEPLASTEQAVELPAPSPPTLVRSKAPTQQRTPEAASSSSEPPEALSSPLDGSALRELLLEIAAAEQALVEGAGVAPTSANPEDLARLEAAVGLVLAHPDHLHMILGFLAPDPAAPLASEGGGEEGEVRAGHQLDPREEYGAVRAIYWTIVISAGRGEERPVMLSVLAALPMVLPAIHHQLIKNLTRAAVDGRLILDSSYLEDLLTLRAMHPEEASIFSALFLAMGDGLSAEERQRLFSIFGVVNDDPVLAGLTIKNLLLGSDPEFALFLAEQRLDDLELPKQVKLAVAHAVIEHADVFSAASFLAEHTELFRNDPTLWFSLGYREGGAEAYEAEYYSLVENNAAARTREMLVAGMKKAPQEDLLRIARSDPEGQVVGQALLTASGKRDGSSAGRREILALIRENRHPGGIHVVQAQGAAYNVARHAKRAGDSQTLDAAVELLTDIARDPSVRESYRRTAIGYLERYLSRQQLDELERGL